MFILELVSKDCEGTWTYPVCISEDRERLFQRTKIERQKKIKEDAYHRNPDYLFKVGDLEDFIFNIVDQAKFIDGQYYLEDEKIGDNENFKNYVENKAQTLCDTLSLDKKLCRYVIHRGFYESLRFQIRHIEEI